MSDAQKIALLRQWLGVVLDQIDFTHGACSPVDMVAQCIPMSVLANARKALKDTA